MHDLILASTSRYRRELLQRLQRPFDVVAPHTDETPLPGEAPAALAPRLALAKARAVAALHPRAVVIGSDQVAELDGQPIGKPGTHERALAQLRKMSGREVLFHTALAVVRAADAHQAVDTAAVHVRFRVLADAEIERYLQLDQPYDCAGSARCESLGVALLDAIDSDDPTALVGLPLIRTCAMLRAAGIDVLRGAPGMTKRGTLLLVPNTLDLGAAALPLHDVLPTAVIQQAAALCHWVAEDARNARAFLKRVSALQPLAAPLQELHIEELPRPRKGSREPVPATAWQALLTSAHQGHDIGLISEAGLPGVADPGAELIAAAHDAGLRVWPLAGASSLLLALAASGLNGQSFAFVGYLPQDAAARTQRIRELEALSRKAAQTQLVIETPYRNATLMQALLVSLAPATRLSVACGLTLPDGWARTRTVAQWRGEPPTLPDTLPAVFAWLAR